MLNDYPTAGECANWVYAFNQWSVQVILDMDLNQASDIHGNLGTPVPLVRDQWVEVLVVVDLDAQLHDIYYNNTAIFENQDWTGVNPGIEALDLYADSAFPGMYHYDDVNFGPVESETEVCAAAATRVRGLPVSGTVADTCTSNDTYFTTRPDVFRTVAVPPVQIRYDFVSPNTDPSEIRLKVEAAGLVALMFERINIRNQDTALYESVNTRVLTTADGSVELVFSGANADKYVNDTTGAVDVLIQCNALAFTIAPIWQYRDDHVLLTVVD
jgi:hypothetical protein